MSDYETSRPAWALNQAALLRAGKFNALDVEHIAEELEYITSDDQRELDKDFPGMYPGDPNAPEREHATY